MSLRKPELRDLKNTKPGTCDFVAQQTSSFLRASAIQKHTEQSTQSTQWSHNVNGFDENLIIFLHFFDKLISVALITRSAAIKSKQI